MPDEETNQEVVEQPNQEGEPNVNPETGNEAPAGTEAETQPTESPEPSQEELAELIEIGRRTKAANITDPEAFMRDYTQKSQELPTVREEIQRRDEVIRKLAGEREQAADPVAAARQRLLDAENSYDPTEKVAAYENYHNVVGQKQREQILADSVRAQEMRASMERSKRYGDFTPEQLGGVHQSLTPEELALVARARQGDLAEVLNADLAAQKTEAEKKARMNQMFGQGSGGQIPGSYEADPVPVIEWANFVTELTKEQQKELLDKGVKILNAPE